MNNEKSSAVSPFSALSYQEQQARWLEWRSRQLDYRPAGKGEIKAETPTASAPARNGLPPLRLPNMRIASPVRHRELDEVMNRHRQALKQAGSFHTTAID